MAETGAVLDFTDADRPGHAAAEAVRLRSEHRDLDTVIARLADHGPVDQIHLQRLKKRKLMLKDEIAWLESRLIPDDIA